MSESTQTDFENKGEILKLFRDYADNKASQIKEKFPEGEYKKRAGNINKELALYKITLLQQLETESFQENWTADKRLGCVLLLTYCYYVVMLESRNRMWPYEYMAFARRIGELWEPFCLICWDYPVNSNITYTEAPTFSDVKDKLILELGDFVDTLDIKNSAKSRLNEFYDLVWNLVVSGEIQLKSDLHFKDQENEYVVDFKSGFSSNEKGNTNRLLMVASIYKALQNYECLLFVRSKEELNNHYLKTLKNSGLWKVYCGDETYKQISKFTQFDLTSWIKLNINWEQDFSKEMYDHLKQNNLAQYLEW